MLPDKINELNCIQFIQILTYRIIKTRDGYMFKKLKKPLKIGVVWHSSTQGMEKIIEINLIYKVLEQSFL